MAIFVLDDAAVAQCESKLVETGQVVHTEAARARDEIASLSGAAWEGGANTAANAKQQGEFSQAAQRLFAEINHISEALGLGRRSTWAQDATSESEFQAVSPAAGMNFGRL